MYSQKFWSLYFILYGFIEFCLAVSFFVLLACSIVFWLAKRKSHKYAFLPLITCISFLTMIVVLPLTWIRNKIEFNLNENEYEAASDIANRCKKSYNHLYQLPGEYESLSVGGGKVELIENQDGSGVLFYKFQGMPDGSSGFLKIYKGDVNILLKNIYHIIYDVKELEIIGIMFLVIKISSTM